jgi:hypothetical protein
MNDVVDYFVFLWNHSCMRKKFFPTISGHSLPVIILLSVLLLISADYNIRYFLMRAQPEQSKSMASAGVPVPGAKKGKSVSFQAVCPHYGFLHDSDLSSFADMTGSVPHVSGVDGYVQGIEANLWIINPEPRLTLMLYGDRKTKAMGSFKAGDCIRAFYAGDGSNRILLIEPQK